MYLLEEGLELACRLELSHAMTPTFRQAALGTYLEMCMIWSGIA